MNPDEQPSFDDLVGDIADSMSDDLMVDGNTPMPTGEEVKEEPKEVEEEPIEQESDDDYLADLDSDDDDDGDTPEETPEAEDDGDSNDGEEQVLFQVDGEDITSKEAKDGYLRQSDYTKKTQELAEQRKAMEEESKTLDYLKVQKEFQPKVLELNSLAMEIAKAEEIVYTGRDSDGTQLTREEIRETEENIKEAKRKHAYETKQVNEKMSKTPPPKINELMEKVPAYFGDDQKAREAVMAQHTTILGDFGFSQVEIGSVTDPRTILMVQEIQDLRELASRVEKAKARRKGNDAVVSKSKKSAPERTTQSSSKPKETKNEAWDKLEAGDMESLGDAFSDFA